MKSRFPGRQARIAVALSALILAASVAVFSSELLGRYRWANETLQTVEPRYARLKGLLEVGPDILTGYARTDAALARIAHPAEFEIARIGTDLQQRVRRIADQHDMRVSGSQILPPRNEDGFVVVTVTATMDGETDAFGAFIHTLAGEEPPVIVEKLLVQAPRPGRRGEVNTRITGQVNLSVIRLLP